MIKLQLIGKIAILLLLTFSLYKNSEYKAMQEVFLQRNSELIVKYELAIDQGFYKGQKYACLEGVEQTIRKYDLPYRYDVFLESVCESNAKASLKAWRIVHDGAKP